MDPRLLLSVPLAFAALLAACGGDDGSAAPAQAAETVELRLLAIGDSVLDWNGDQSTPEQAGRVLNERGIPTSVENRAISGSCLGSCGDPGESIPANYSDDGWTHVLVSGGGNDLGDECTSADPLISPDLRTGLMVELIDSMPTTTTVLLYLYAPPSDTADPLATCEQFPVLLDRYRALADARDHVLAADAGSVVDRTTPEYYADSVHPSPEGSLVIGTMIADLIETTR